MTDDDGDNDARNNNEMSWVSSSQSVEEVDLIAIINILVKHLPGFDS